MTDILKQYYFREMERLPADQLLDIHTKVKQRLFVDAGGAKGGLSACGAKGSGDGSKGGWNAGGAKGSWEGWAGGA